MSKRVPSATHNFTTDKSKGSAHRADPFWLGFPPLKPHAPTYTTTEYKTQVDSWVVFEVKKRLWLSGLAAGLAMLLSAALPSLSVQETSSDGPAELPSVVALTFDDGPNCSTTPALLDGLALREIPATFFLVGECISGNEALVQRMEQEGHQIGIHTYHHIRLTEASPAECESELRQTRSLLTQILGPGDYWLRPPYGLFDQNTIQCAESPLVLWSVDPEDWKDRDTQRIINAALNGVQDGDILLFHDLYSSSVDAALQVADTLRERGFELVTVRQLFELRGVHPKTGVVYRSFHT